MDDIKTFIKLQKQYQERHGALTGQVRSLVNWILDWRKIPYRFVRIEAVDEKRIVVMTEARFGCGCCQREGRSFWFSSNYLKSFDWSKVRELTGNDNFSNESDDEDVL